MPMLVQPGTNVSKGQSYQRPIHTQAGHGGGAPGAESCLLGVFREMLCPI